MSGISHKQAVQFIDRRVDEMLNEGQRFLLDEHLRVCDSCRAYAAQMEGLSAYVQNEFHRRWDSQSGPSQNVLEHVTTKGRRIHMANRISSGVKLFAGAMALMALAVAINFMISQLQSTSPVMNATEAVDNAPLPADRLLAFASEQNGSVDIYTMHADGSGLTNITNHPAIDAYPFWSPDGKRIAFTSDRDGSNQIYLMDADGSNVIQLTNGEGNYWFDVNRYTPWSPDGKKLIFSHKLPGEQSYKLYVMDVADKTITTLTNEAGQYFLTSWSPEGEHIAFAADTGSTPRDLFMVSSDGTRLTKLTENLSGGEFFISDYHWSQNGETLIFITGANVYAAGPDGSLSVIHTADNQILDWWNGTALLDDPEDTLTWLRTDGSQSMLDLCQNSQLLGIAHKRSYGGNLVVASNCSDSGWMLYWANSDGTMVHQLLDTSTSEDDEILFNLTWSPDDQYFAFVSSNITPPDVTETLYVLDVAKAREDPSTQPLKMTNSFGPSWQPVHTPRLADNSTELKIDPQSCKSASELTSDLQPPNALYGYDLVQGTSFVNGHFSYEFWLYCDPTLKPDDNEHFSSIAGLGLYASWRYNGPQVDGTSQDYFGFEPVVKGKSFTKWTGPLYNASANGKFGMLAAETIREHIRAGTPLEFSIVVESSLGENSATFSFHLESTGSGLRVVNLQPTQAGNHYEGLIAFISAIENGNLDIYTMRADGSALTNITNNPADDVNPFWSPGGKHIAFMSDRTGFMQILVMDVNGDNVVQLTNDETNYRMQDFDPWSPDGSKLIFLEETSLEEKWMLYVMDADGENKTLLIDEPINYSALSWGPDGKHIAFISNRPQNPDALGLYVVDMDGKNIVEITEQLERNERLDNFRYDWSGDGQSIFFIAYKHISEGNDQWTVYEANLDGGGLTKRATSGTPMEDWWDGTSFIRSFDGSTLTWLRSDATFNTFQPFEDCQSADDLQYGFLAKRSSDGNQLIQVDCPNDDMWIYYANSDGTIVRQLLSSPLVVREGIIGNMVWSPDDRFTAVTIASPDQTNLYILDLAASLKDPSLQPLQLTISDSFLYYSPAWQPIH